ncbi:MAG: hypothetical protein NC127_04125 [Muribaculum sp.]|nr:hypothetical protein [Muribaculum sp.]
MAKEKKYRCLNFGNCDTADKKKDFTIPEGEDLKCPDCGSEMIEEVKGGGFPMWIVGVIAVAIIAAGAVIFWPKGENKATTPDPEGTEFVDDEEDGGYNETEEPEDDGNGEDEVVSEPDTVFVETVVQTTDTVVVERVDTVEKVVTKEVSSSNHLNNYNLGWGLYTGPSKAGKPHGTGEVTVTKSYSIDLKSGGKTIEVGNGDKIISARFKEGKLVGGTVKFANGTTKKFDIGV